MKKAPELIRKKLSEMNNEEFRTELLHDTLRATRINLIRNTGKSFIHRPDETVDGQIFRIDLFGMEDGGWYHIQWFDKNGNHVKTVLYEN